MRRFARNDRLGTDIPFGVSVPDRPARRWDATSRNDGRFVATGVATLHRLGDTAVKEAIDRILQAEEDAKRMVQDAREEARKIVETARKATRQTIEQAREDARKEAQEILEKARQDAAAEKERIIAEAETRAKLIVESATVEDFSLITEAARKASGLEQ